MNVLVIGGDGQLGQALAAAGKPDGMRLAFRDLPDVDLTRPETIAAAIEATAADAIVNAAAFTAVDKAEAEPALAEAVNAAGAGSLAELCDSAAIPLIHISTDYVFDGAKPAPYLETDPTAPLGVYGRTKLAGEVAVASRAAHHIILRTAWVFSPFAGNFAKTMLRLAATRDELRVVDDQIGTPTYAPHLADAIIAIASEIRHSRRDTFPWGLYHASGRGETSWCGLARAILEVSAAAGGPTAAVTAITTADYPTPARRPANSRLDCSKLEASFALALPHWRVGVANFIAHQHRSTAAEGHAA